MDMIVQWFNLSFLTIVHVPFVYTLQAVKRKIELEAEHERGARMLQRKNGRLNQLQAQLRDFQMQHMQFTQVSCSLKPIKNKFTLQVCSSR